MTVIVNKTDAANWNTVDSLDQMIWNQLVRQFWVDEEIPLSDDKNSWNTLNKKQQDTYKKVLGGLTSLDTQQGSLGMPIISLSVNDSRKKAILGYMGFMEHMHAKSYSSIFSTVCTTDEINDIFDWTNTNIYLVEKMRIIQDIYTNISKYGLDVAMATSVLLESFLFYSGFFYPLYLAGKGKMTSSNEIINLIIRDESSLEGTEILTPNGWELIQNIHSKQCKVAQYNSDGTIEFVKPIKISTHTKDHAYEIKSYQGHIDQVVSPNHRIILEKKGKLLEVHAQDLEKRHFNFPNCIIGLLRGGQNVQVWAGQGGLLVINILQLK